MLSKALLSSQSMNWCTPIEFFEKLDREFFFDLDPAATQKSAKCKKYFTPKENGLAQSWEGHTVFCNPPYGRQIAQWVEKGFRESQKAGTTVVMLIPARTDTQYWHECIFNDKAEEIRFIKGRLKFTDENGITTNPAPFPSALVIFRSPDQGKRRTKLSTM